MALDVERIRKLVEDETVELPTITAAQAESTVLLLQLNGGDRSRAPGKGRDR